MSDYSVRLRSYNSDTSEWETAYTFPTTPFASPKIDYEHDDQEPPKRSVASITYAIEAKLYGSSNEAVQEAWAELRAAIESSTAPAQGMQLMHGDTIVEDISPEGGWDEFKIESLSSPKSDSQWATEMVAVLVITASKRIETGGTGSGISDLKWTLTYSYDEAGLLTKTLDGELEVTSGNSAETIARTLGLELPSSSFAYVTRGPEGVDVTVLDRADRAARFTSSVRESGQALPSGVGPGFSVEVREETRDGETITTTTVFAEGPSAVAAVKSKRPSGKSEETQTKNDPRRTASAVYVQKKTAPNATPMKRRNFTTSGGGRSVKWMRRTGGRKPVKHFGSYEEVSVDETITLERTGLPNFLLTELILPTPLDKALVTATGGLTLRGGPDLIEKGKDVGGDRWQIVVGRRYTGASIFDAFTAVAQAVVATQPSNTSLLAAIKTVPTGKD